MSVVFEDNVAYLEGSHAAVYFSQTSNGFQKNSTGTPTLIKKLITSLDIAPWGEDNRFPQNITNLMDYTGVGKSLLDKKARSLWANGIIPGKITGYEDEGKEEIFQPLDRQQYKPVYDFIEARWFYRFYLEFLRDWTWYGNCFPEVILSNDGKSIAKFVHQESCDVRYKQMNDQGQIDTVYLSKLWGMSQDQFVKFDPSKSIKGLVANPANITSVDGKLVKQLDCIDMYDALNSLKRISGKFKSATGLKSAILPVNYPSSNKTYYQLPDWDGARLSGWIEIAGKIPAMFKALYNKSFSIKYHIKIPWLYFEKKYGKAWLDADLEAKRKIVSNELQVMDKFLSGSEKAYTSFVSFFEVDKTDRKDYAKLEIDSLDNKSSQEKDLITSQAVNSEIAFAMGVHPDQMGIGAPGGPYSGSAGSGSNIREGKLVYDALLNLEREVILEPLYLVRDYNREVGGMKEWEEDIRFKFRDIVLTTLDAGSGTEKVIS